jgi:AAA ATPase domain
VLDAGLVEAGGAARVSPLVGRDAELAQLRDEWREAIAGRARLVLVSGEPGIGKTRLVDELRMQVDGVAVDARGYSVGAPIAYAMMTSWLRSQPVAARLTRLAPAELTELSRLLPELAERVPPPEPLPEAELRRRLFGAVVRALLAGWHADAARRRRYAVVGPTVAAARALRAARDAVSEAARRRNGAAG